MSNNPNLWAVGMSKVVYSACIVYSVSNIHSPNFSFCWLKIIGAKLLHWQQNAVHAVVYCAFMAGTYNDRFSEVYCTLCSCCFGVFLSTWASFYIASWLFCSVVLFIFSWFFQNMNGRFVMLCMVCEKCPLIVQFPVISEQILGLWLLFFRDKWIPTVQTAETCFKCKVFIFVVG